MILRFSLFEKGISTTIHEVQLFGCSEFCCGQELHGVNALVIPGGESTVIVKLLLEFGMFDSVKRFGESVNEYTLCVYVGPDFHFFHRDFQCSVLALDVS
jgi:hypothetical protein